MSGEDARARLPISSLHPGVWPPRRRDWALCRRTSARTRQRDTWRPLQSEGGKSRIPERPSLQVDFCNAVIYPADFPPSQSPTAFCTAQPNLNLSPIKAIHAELGQNAPAVMLHQLHDVVARICVFSVFIYYCAHILFI